MEYPWNPWRIITSKTLLSKKTIMWRLKKSQSNDKLLEKLTSSTDYMGKKHSSKQVAYITYTLEKIIFGAASFEGS